MIIWTFDSDAEIWSTGDYSWDGGDGSPDPGCLARTGTFQTAATEATALAIPVAAGYGLAFWYKYTKTGGIADFRLEIYDVDNNSLGVLATNPGAGTNTIGWTRVSLDGIVSAGIVHHISFGATLTGVNTFSVVKVDGIEIIQHFDLTHSSGGIPGGIIL